MVVKILKTDKRLGVKAGELYSAEPYWLEPTCKVTLLKNLKTGKEGTCNQYWSEVEIVDGNRRKEVQKACNEHSSKISKFLSQIR